MMFGAGGTNATTSSDSLSVPRRLTLFLDASVAVDWAVRIDSSRLAHIWRDENIIHAIFTSQVIAEFRLG